MNGHRVEHVVIDEVHVWKTTNQKGEGMKKKEPEIVRDEAAYQAFLKFLEDVSFATTLAEVNVAAGALREELERG